MKIKSLNQGITLGKGASCTDGRKCAFSLIEIMVGLIVMSVMVAAFAPVITKKVQTSSVALSQQDNIAARMIKSLLFSYETSNGCETVDSGTALICPFEIDEGVEEINLVMVSGGGGGAKGLDVSLANSSDNTNNHNPITINITASTKNVVVSGLASGGGNGGNGYHAHSHTDGYTKRPQNQSDCNKILSSGLVYSNAKSCVTTSNLSDKSVTASGITYLAKTNNAYSTDQGDNVCWSNTASSNDNKVARTGVTTTIGAVTSRHHGTDKTYTSLYPVCTYKAAQKICDLYAPSASYDGYSVKFRLINSTEASFIANSAYKNDVEAFYYNGDEEDKVNIAKSHLCYTHKSTHSIAVHEYYWNDKGCSDTSDISHGTHTTDPYTYDLCLPEYGWLNNGEPGLLKPQASYYVMYKNCGSACGGWHKYKRGIRAVFVSSANTNAGDVDAPQPTKCTATCTSGKGCAEYKNIQTRGLTFINKERAPFSVRCAVDTIGYVGATDTYNLAAGGGGGSGAYLSNITIPQTKITSAIGGVVEIRAGGAGGESSVIVKKGTTVYWGVKIAGGSAGGTANASAAGGGGAGVSKYQYWNGSSWVDKTGAISGEVGSFEAGHNGGGGSRQLASGSVAGGYGGGAVGTYYGAGGKGGDAASDSHGNGGGGGAGYAAVSYQTASIGGPGGGGGGGQLIRVEKIAVTPGVRYWVKVGLGGAAGSNSSNGGTGGTSALCKDKGCTQIMYSVSGGAGGNRGTYQANSTSAPGKGTGGAKGTASTGTISFKYQGDAGVDGEVDATTYKGKGGRGGLGGTGIYYRTNMTGKPTFPWTEISVPCGGFYGTGNDTSYGCNNSTVHGMFTNGGFAAPGKVHREGSTKYGQAGAGGAGGGVDPNTTTQGNATPGQNGYVYIWWEDYAD